MHAPIANGIKISREKKNNNENQNFLNSFFFLLSACILTHSQRLCAFSIKFQRKFFITYKILTTKFLSSIFLLSSFVDDDYYYYYYYFSA